MQTGNRGFTKAGSVWAGKPKLTFPLSKNFFLLFSFFVLIVFYFVVGALYMKTVRSAEGWDLIPNRELWASLGSNIKVCKRKRSEVSTCFGKKFVFLFAERRRKGKEFHCQSFLLSRSLLFCPFLTLSLTHPFFTL